MGNEGLENRSDPFKTLTALTDQASFTESVSLENFLKLVTTTRLTKGKHQ